MRTTRLAATGLAVVGSLALAAQPALAARPSAGADAAPGLSDWSCGSGASLVGYSDGLDKLPSHGAEVSGLSDMAWDAQSGSFLSSLDNDGTTPSYLWFYRNLASPTVTREPLVLKQPDGTPYNGQTADNEGLAVDRHGDYMVSSEVEPSIRVFGRDGVQKASLEVPSRFQVAPAGEATRNATLEGLTLSPDKRTLVAAMEGTLSGDEPTDGSAANYRRFLVYKATAKGWKLAEQVGYRVDDGMRIAEVQEYAPGKLLVLEASWGATTGNAVKLYAVTGLDHARDVSKVANLSTRPGLVVRKRLAVDVNQCPAVGGPALETQQNVLMDNYEGMNTAPLGRHRYRVTLVSDDNNSAKQRTRLLTLAVRLP